MKLYLDLYHGRKKLNQDMDDWGTLGPVLGPFEHVSMTYLSHLKCVGKNFEWLAEFQVVKDLIYYNGVFYGDFTIFTLDDKPADERKAFLARFEVFNPNKAIIPKRFWKAGKKR